MIAGTVEEADLPVETPERAVGGVSTKTLAFGSFCHVVEVPDLTISLTSNTLKLLTACIRDCWSFWSCYREVAVWGVLAGGGVGVALIEEEALVGPVVGEGGEHEVVAVVVGDTLRLALKLGIQVKDSANNVGYRVERAEYTIVEEVALGGFRFPCGAGEEKEED